MRLGEVSLLTNNVVKLADFYKALLEINNDSNDEVHQTIIAEETMLTIYNDGSIKNNDNQNMCIAFTVDNIEKEYQKVLALGAEIIEKPTKRPWGAVNMSFYDPDRNVIYLRSFSTETEAAIAEGRRIAADPNIKGYKSLDDWREALDEI